MFYAYALRGERYYARAHMNVTTITRFVQNYTVGSAYIVCCVASIMHVAILWPYSQAVFTALQSYTLKTLFFSVLHCKASWKYIEYRGCTSVTTLCTVFRTIFIFCLVCQ